MVDVELTAALEQAPTDPVKPTTTRNRAAPDPAFGYDTLSIALHWFGVIAIVALAVSSGPLHASLGYLLVIILAFRAFRRFANGFPRVADQAIMLNVLERLTIIVMLISLLILSLTGVAMALFEGREYIVFGWSTGNIAWSGNALAAEINRTAHQTAATALLASTALHILAALRHIIVKRTAIALRIMRPVQGGK